MDPFRRLICFAFGVLISALVLLPYARAETIAATLETQSTSTLWKYQQSCSGTIRVDSGYQYSSQAVACTSMSQAALNWGASAYVGACPSTFTGANVSWNGSACKFDIKNSSGSTVYTNISLGSFSSGAGCPTGWTASGGQCQRYTCPSTGAWTLSGTSCTRSDCPGDQTRKPDGTCGCQPWGDQDYTWSHLYPTPLRQWPPPVVRCISSCEYRGQPFSANSSTGQVWFNGGMTGSTCEGGDDPQYDPPDGQDPPADPPSEPETPTNDEAACLRSGGSPGEVSGQPVCLPRGTPGNPRSPGETNERTTNPDGSTRDRTETPVTNCSTEGCTTTTTVVETVCESGGSPCTTTTTTRTEPADDSKDGNGDDEGDPFCEANPTDPTCKRSAWSGTCSAFTCDGDAVQCAIAQEQHKRNCELLTDTGDLARADAVAAFNSEVADFDKSELTTTTPLDSITGQTLYASALADQTFTIHGQTITLPFSSLVDYLNYAGIAFMIVCGMVSVRVFSTVLG